MKNYSFLQCYLTILKNRLLNLTVSFVSLPPTQLFPIRKPKQQKKTLKSLNSHDWQTKLGKRCAMFCKDGYILFFPKIKQMMELLQTNKYSGPMTGLAKIRLVRESRSCWEAQFCPGEGNVQGAQETAVPAPMGRPYCPMRGPTWTLLLCQV